MNLMFEISELVGKVKRGYKAPSLEMSNSGFFIGLKTSIENIGKNIGKLWIFYWQK